MRQIFMLVGLLGIGCSSTPHSGGTSTGTLPPAPAGAPCTADAICASGICGAIVDGGSGNCCAVGCGDDPLCGTTFCDATGACTYPKAGLSCGSSCLDATLAPRTCDGSGSCRLKPDSGSPCPNDLRCGDAGACNASCGSATDCAEGFTCKAGACFPKVATGPCEDNADCTSGICGAAGTGNCCATSCIFSAVSTCGASDCDRITGACLYVDAGTPCGSVTCTAGSDLSPTLCDGLGACSATSCAPYLCGAGNCQTRCTDSTSCKDGAFCELATLACCAGLTDGASLSVDALAGSDTTPCCGFGGAAPCQTITHAMHLIETAHANNVTIVATVGFDGGDWPFGSENTSFPGGFPDHTITLGLGVELVAPGIYFQNTIAVASLDADAGSQEASIVGAGTNPVQIGISSTGEGYETGISVNDNATLYIANARVFGDPLSQSTAMAVGGHLVLGQDKSGRTAGTVYVGAPEIGGYTGISCSSCTITDAVLPGMSSVVIQNQTATHLFVNGSPGSPATVSLASAPVIGRPPLSAGFGTCATKAGDGIGISGEATATLSNVTVQCLAGIGIYVGGGGDAGSIVSVDKTTIQNVSEGIEVTGGLITVSRSTLQYNYIGVWQDAIPGYSTGSVDLSGPLGHNTVACDSSSEAIYPIVRGGFGVPAIAVLNSTPGTLNASNVSWDTSGPDQFACDTSATTCGCTIAACFNTGGADGMDAVTISAGPITVDGHTLASVDCTPPPPCGAGHQCLAGQLCCVDSGYCIPTAFADACAD